MSTMTVGRNDPCPCGSGKKYKHCHGAATRDVPAPEERAWRRLRAALDGFPTRMLRFAREVYGPGVVDEAWAEFVLWDNEAGEFDPDSFHVPVFIPWFFHRWTPDPADTLVAEASLHGRSPTSVLLERRGRKLDPVLRRYLEACVATPFSFHEVVRVDPGYGFRARDVFTGEEREVLERSASRTFRRGDILFGQLVTSDGVTTLEACSSVMMPPDRKLRLIDARDYMLERPVHFTPETLADWDTELREEYLECVDELMNPPMPRLENTDGEPMEFHRLHFEVPSAREAFDALKHLALDESEAELLESAELDDDGRLRRVSFPWKVAGNPFHDHWDSTVLGNIEIDDRRLVVEVNSAGRAARLKEIVESSYPAARHTGTDVETLEEALARSEESGPAPESGEMAALMEHPEVREQLRAFMARHYDNWIHEPIPALGGRSPMEAVKDRSGREKVEALIATIERDGRRMNPPLDEAVTRRIREQLGL